MRNVTKRIPTTSTWVASTDLAPVDLPREGIITEITIRSNITATLTAAAYDDVFRRHIQNIRIEGDGGRAYLGLSGVQMSSLLGLWNNIAYGMPTVTSNGAGVALSAPDVGSTTFTTIHKFHCGSNPRDPFDLTAGIPASKLSTLQARLTTTVAAVTDAAGPITAGTFQYEVCQVMIDPVPGMMTPTGSTLVLPTVGNFSDYSNKIDVPAGAFLRSIIIRVFDATATVPRRVNNKVTGIRLERPRAGDYLIEQNFSEAGAAMMMRHPGNLSSGDVGPIGAIATTRPSPAGAIDMVPAGFVIIDLRPYGDPVYGLDLRNYQTGDFKLGLTHANFAAGDATTIYWDQLIPWAG